MNLSTLIATIQTETTISSQWEDPNYLSELLLRLASYYSTLGSFVADAEQQQDFAKTKFEVMRETAKVDYITEGDSVALAESKAVTVTKGEKDEYAKLKYKARLLFITRQSLEKNLDAIRSRLSYIKSDQQAQR